MTPEQKLSHARGMKTAYERTLYDATVHGCPVEIAHCRKRIGQWEAEIAALEAEVDASPGIDAAALAHAYSGVDGGKRPCGWN